MRFLLKLLPMLLGKKKNWAGILAILAAVGFFNKDKFSLDFVQSLWAEPREILVDRVEDARDTQQETAEEFKTTLEKFKAVTQFEGGELEAKYNELNAAYLKSEKVAQGITKKVDRITDASNALLKEWKDELKNYNSPEMRRKSEERFDATRDKLDQLIKAMRKAEEKTKPVLDGFRDHVLSLKHNLNAEAIASLDEEAKIIESNVGDLIKEMEASIAEADAFIRTLQGDSA